MRLRLAKRSNLAPLQEAPELGAPAKISARWELNVVCPFRVLLFSPLLGGAALAVLCDLKYNNREQPNPALAESYVETDIWPAPEFL